MARGRTDPYRVSPWTERLVQRIPDPARWTLWVPVGMVIKLITVCVLLAAGSTGNGEAGQLGTMGGDSSSYFDPIGSILRGGDHAPDVRMPGYGAAYLLARTVSSPPATYDVLVVLQLLLGAVAMYILGRMAYRLTGSRAAFALTILLHALSISVQWYDVMMLTESFATSALILFLDRCLTWTRTGERAALVIAGLWLTWAIFLKPVLAPLPAVVLLAIWYARGQYPDHMRNAFLFLLPLILIDGSWVVRNAVKYDGIYPLTRTLFVSDDHPDPKLSASKFVIAFGGDMVFWVDPRAEVRFFNVGNDQVPGKTNAQEIELPTRIMTSAYNLDSLKMISDRILAMKARSFPAELREQETDRINTTLHRYRSVFIQEHPFQYHVVSRLCALTTFLDQTGDPVPYSKTFAQLPLRLKALKLFHIAMHWATLLFGVIGSILWWRSGRSRTFARILAPIIPFGLLIFPIGLRFSEHRYLVPFIPLLLLAAIVGSWSRLANRT